MKKFLSYFNIFELNLTSTSYKSGLIRIIASVLVMMIVCIFRFSVTLSNPVVNIIVSLLVMAIMVLSVMCLFVASVECLQVGDNIKKCKARENDKYK